MTKLITSPHITSYLFTASNKKTFLSNEKHFLVVAAEMANGGSLTSYTLYSDSSLFFVINQKVNSTPQTFSLRLLVQRFAHRFQISRKHFFFACLRIHFFVFTPFRVLAAIRLFPSWFLLNILRSKDSKKDKKNLIVINNNNNNRIKGWEAKRGERLSKYIMT